MVSEDKLALILSLQQFALNIEDSSRILASLLPFTLKELSKLDQSAQFIAVAFLNSEAKISQSLLYDQSMDATGALDAPGELIITKDLFTQGGKWEKELLWGHTIAISELETVLDESYVNFGKINSLIISPCQINRKLAGVLIVGSTRDKSAFPPEDQDLYKQITNLVSSGFRLQDLQDNLSHVTQEIYKMNAKLHELDKLKDDFVSVASHELRTPMTAIRSYAWMALNKSDVPLSDKLKRYLSRTMISTERLINLVNDMLNISRIESGRVEIIPEVFDIQQLVSEVGNEVYAKAKEKNLLLKIEHAQIPKVFADSDKVHQVLLNLVGNALKFTPSGQEVELSFFSDGQFVQVNVKDNGVGISAEDQPRLFKKFGRLDNSYIAIATSEGTGLGLYISKELVERMGGKVAVVSEGLGKGATFSFTLPVASEQTIEQANKFTNKVKGEAKLLEPMSI